MNDFLVQSIVFIIAHANQFAIVIESVSHRERAALIWILVVALFLLLKYKELRSIPGELLQPLFSKTIRVVTFIFFLYIIFSCWLLKNVGYWNLSLLKTSVLWGSIQIFAVYKLADAKSYEYFKSIIKKSAGWSVLLIFFTRLFSFSFVTELIVLPITGLLVLVKVALEVKKKAKKEDKRVLKFSTKAINFYGIVLFVYAIFKTILDPSDVFSLHNGKELLFTPILTLGFIPVVYTAVLWIQYSSVFHCLKYTTKGGKRVNQLFLKSFQECGLSINRIARLQKGLQWDHPPTFDDINILASPFDFHSIGIGNTFDEVRRNFVSLNAKFVEPVKYDVDEKIYHYKYEPILAYRLTGSANVIFDREFHLELASISFLDLYSDGDQLKKQEISDDLVDRLVNNHTLQYGNPSIETNENTKCWNWLNDSVWYVVSIDFSDAASKTVSILQLFKCRWNFPTLDLS